MRRNTWTGRSGSRASRLLSSRVSRTSTSQPKVFSVVGRDPADTLASLERLSLSLNYMEAMKGRIKVKHAILEHPRIFLHQYDSTRASWNIIKIPSSEDTSSFTLPPISVGRVSLEKSPYIEYSSVPDSINLAAALDHLTIKEPQGPLRA